MKKNYKLQNTNYKQSTCLKKRQVPYDKLQITSIRGVLRTYFKLSIVNFQLSMNLLDGHK
jgi:hypothetical protein